MPRRESYQTDDEDDDRRARPSGGGGVPGWVWVAGGGGVLAVLLLVGMMFFAFTARREAVMRHEVAQADMMRAEVQARPPVADHGHAGFGAGPGVGAEVEVEVRDGPADLKLPELTLTQIARAYKSDPAAAGRQYTDQRLRVQVVVRATGAGWVGAVADFGAGTPRGTEANVIFRLTGAPVAVGRTVVIEGHCAGLLSDPRGGETLTFTDCRVVPE